YKTDPLAAGVEIAAKHGLVVVAAAGNGGPASGTVESPAIDPYVLSVGSTDDQATLSLNDDALAWFSAWGTPADSTPKPELVGPGRKVVSIRVPGSTLDTHLPDHVVTANNGATYFRLTGTSMATAVVSGAAALLLERQPNLTPDQVKAILVGTTQRYGQDSGKGLPNPIAGGSGLLDAYAAVNAAPAAAPSTAPVPGGFVPSATQSVEPLACANHALRPGDGLARALYPVLYGS